MKTTDELRTQGKVDYQEFNGLFNGRPHTDIPKIVDGNNLSYGALSYGDNDPDGRVDINYKSICATVTKDENGNCRVDTHYEVYNENGVPCAYETETTNN